jgi:hypothetical protein
MIIMGLAQAVAAAQGDPADCLARLTREERGQDEAARAAKRRAGGLVLLEPDDDQLPADAPADFPPVVVTLSYMIGADGRVTDCATKKGGDVPVLDAASCALLRRHLRARSGPATSRPQKAGVLWTPRAVRPERRACNDNGGTVPVSSDRWITSQVFSGAGLQAGSAHVQLEIGATGRVERCAIKAADIGAALQRNLCDAAIRRATVLPAVDAAGEPVAGRLRFVVRFVLPG